jgi:predicted metal-dependent enzyme (double-stranded beta helix superfamily)
MTVVKDRNETNEQWIAAQARRELRKNRNRPLPVALDSELEETELRELAHAIADRPELWQHHLDHRPEQRTYTRVLHNDNVEAYVICWMDGHDTGFHDHDVSRGAMAVITGEVHEDRLAIGGTPLTKQLVGGQSVTFGAADIHRVRHAGEAPAVTIHVYSPPIRQMGQYEFEEGGTLKRFARASDEELKPAGTEVRAVA